MKVRITRLIDIEVSYVRIVLPVNYEEEDIPNDFPLRDGEVWGPATVEIDTGRILEWPAGRPGSIDNMKVVDAGVYTLIGRDRKQIAERRDCAPNRLIPGHYGDYVTLHIDSSGVITNWPTEPDVSEFFESD